ncbi:threonine/homoserine efflux transporter RhtA [Tepidamorphus gemmatus]|uniref:Threonine/homoserine efflux transporter RhtA n=1 Tax=Tepidamorphus gemmatus TaxID=747076 RepID=A0A4R3MHR2_9HYPH|nr:DMT family transporter [Tepidamorphus gemmatus]TCT13297.1 threonine/homoserine efflux transporter RhtA [Tepidamorphus gemmatus]
MSGMAETDVGTQDGRAAALAFGALVLGAFAMGISPVFVRLAEVGPFASAFWRVALALPALYAWMQFDARSTAADAPWFGRSVVVVGALFAGDLFFWHLAIMNTTVANATFLAALAPVMVVAGSWLVLREAVGREVVLGLGLGVVGAGFLLGSSYSFAPSHLLGDAYGLITAAFFGAYILAVRPARRHYGAGRLIFQSSCVTAAILLVIALVLEPTLFPSSMTGVMMLAALALVSHVGGQGLLAVALGTLPAAFSSVVILLEGVAAALFGWLVLSEHLTWLQALGSAAIFAGIWIARPRRPRRSARA